ncbi:PSD1 and planctomycete cytochrome C domain-containing protein [Aureliella helgolandensis]|uniref:Planctomycete cytochrome C n=1 Tax=Aureliella helgolandensis TaxID=2527968 RepID=A0A518G6H0_9BACT|nr:PSD1 and planctomycete cytochrome C domain-containing protein [Aureliella helgolandensis]QDV24187.1 Planctomycete cytochrome C [Aureliella helgolandensis]
MLKSTIYSVLLIASLLTSRYVAAQGVDFQNDIAPILEERCWYCHGEDEQESGLRLDIRHVMLKGGDSGLASIVPDKPEKSYLLELIRHDDEDERMPPDEDRLPDNEIDLLTRWIKEGAVWPGQMEAVAEEKSDHWAFQPIARADTPKLETHPENPIDAFLLQSLARHELSFSKAADPVALIRRASIVLTGLAPTPEETAEFVAAYANDSDLAYTGLVDRLLESPHFGERWAQHWLDVIRWAETNGSESNMYRKNAWIYRDYVIRAFNEDKPYDRFLFEQIAGDTVGQGDATGYLVSGPHVPVATVGQEPAARRQARADRMDEILQTIGASAMGMTVGCARCHNHKFDPIAITDYYSMSAVFQDIEFGSRFPELAEDHPRRLRGEELFSQVFKLRAKLREMGPWEEHWTGFREIYFPPTTTKSLRITFLAKSAYIDELEVFGNKYGYQNLALASQGTKVHSPEQFAVLRKELDNINDGQYGTEQWAGMSPEGSDEQPWVEFTFSDPREINRIRISSNREDFLETDYLEGLNTGHVAPYRIEVQNDAGQWVPVAATPQYQQLNKQHRPRSGILKDVQKLVDQINEEGPKPSFIARFVQPAKTYVFSRGSPESPRDEVFASGLVELDGELNLDSDATGKQRRVAFAKWLIDPSNPLTARVAANRLWHHVFGGGIVTTTSDFGAAGSLPTHPELLDWLAAELMQPTVSSEPTALAAGPQPWSMKHLIRLMVLSEAFQQSSQPREEALAVDGDSALLWRFPPKRVEAEVIRDSILLASGSLDRSLGGRSFRIHNVKKRYAQWEVTDNHGPTTWRRMIYQERMRRVDDQMFTAFDFPDCGQVRAKRPVSTTPLQALNLMNSEFVIDQSKQIAARANQDTSGDEIQSVDRCFELLLGRAPDADERRDCIALAKASDLSFVCRAIINSNEFAFIP